MSNAKQATWDQIKENIYGQKVEDIRVGPELITIKMENQKGVLIFLKDLNENDIPKFALADIDLCKS